MQKYSSKQEFLLYLFGKILKDGGRYLVLPVNELGIILSI